MLSFTPSFFSKWENHYQEMFHQIRQTCHILVWHLLHTLEYIYKCLAYHAICRYCLLLSSICKQYFRLVSIIFNLAFKKPQSVASIDIDVHV